MAKKDLKPSVLLARALKLFGPKGEYWIKGEEDVEPGTFIGPEGQIWYQDSTPPKGYRKLSSTGYCSIGALEEVDTLNEDLAEGFLGMAMMMEESFRADRVMFDDLIPEQNDKKETTFEDVKRWFANAIKMAKAVGR